MIYLKPRRWLPDRTRYVSERFISASQPFPPLRRVRKWVSCTVRSWTSPTKPVSHHSGDVVCPQSEMCERTALGSARARRACSERGAKKIALYMSQMTHMNVMHGSNQSASATGNLQEVIRTRAAGPASTSPCHLHSRRGRQGCLYGPPAPSRCRLRPPV